MDPRLPAPRPFSFPFWGHLFASSLHVEGRSVSPASSSGWDSRQTRSVCPSAALLCINRCAGKAGRARSLRGWEVCFLEASPLQPPARGQDAFLVQTVELAVLPKGLFPSPFHPPPAPFVPGNAVCVAQAPHFCQSKHFQQRRLLRRC